MPEGTILKPEPVLRWLGVSVDRKMTFKYHVQTKRLSATRAFMSISRFASCQKRLSLQALTQLFQTCVTTVSDFGAKVWWKGEVGLSNSIQQGQNAAIRKVAGGFRTTRTAALQAETALPRMVFRLDARQIKYALRLLSMAPLHPLLGLCPDTWPSTQDSDNTDNPKCTE